jgi:hypothetical protein
MVSGPFPEPLFASRRDSFAPSRIQVTATWSFFDQIVEEFFASFDDDLFGHVVGGDGRRDPAPSKRQHPKTSSQY